MYVKLKLNYARNSLRYIIKTYNIKELYLPYYLCDVIRHAVIKENCKPVFYHIDDNFIPINKFPLNAYILYPNYFGICDKNVKVLVGKYNNLIVDNSHSFYSEPKGFACFNSQRKFEKNVYNGSYLWTKKMGEKLEYKNILTFLPNEMKFYENRICGISPCFIVDNKIDDKNNEKRKKIFYKLHEKYSTKNLLNIDLAFCSSPFCYPYLFETAKEANEFALSLEKHGYRINRYWNKLPKTYNEYKFYERLVPIPIDCK